MDTLPLDLLLGADARATGGRAIDRLDPTPVTDVLEHLLQVRLTGHEAVLARFDDDTVADAVLAALVADGLITAGRSIGLTDDGLAVATDRVRKHRLAERMLGDMLGVAWRTVHQEARRWEVLLSDEVEARLVELLDDPGTCPHGNPIPGSGNAPDQDAAVRLGSLTEGLVRVVRIEQELEADDDALTLLDAAGFVPGAEGEVLGSDDAGTVRIAGATADAAVPAHVAARTWVEVVG